MRWRLLALLAYTPLTSALTRSERERQDAEVHLTDDDIRQHTGLSDKEALERLCSLYDANGQMRNCLVPVDKGAGGGMGAVVGSVFEFMVTALENNCVFVHRTNILSIVGHGVDRQLLEAYLGIGHGCPQWVMEPGIKYEKPESGRTVDIQANDAEQTILKATVRHSTVSRQTGMQGPCEKQLKEPTLCLLERGKGRKDGKGSKMIARQIVRYWYRVKFDMPEKELTWFQASGRGRGPHVNLVFHLRRGDVHRWMKDRWTGDEYITQAFQHLVRMLQAVRERLGKAGSKLKFHLHFLSQGRELAFPLLGTWKQILEDGGISFDAHLGFKAGRTKHDELALPSFTHMAEADILLRGHSSFPAVAQTFYFSGVPIIYGPDDEIGEISGVFSEAVVDHITQYLLKRHLSQQT